jgi:shikimate 5-dehydrogenase
MLYRPEKTPLLATLREKGLSGIFVGLTALAMAGWVYLLSSIFLKFVFWCFS